MRGRLFCIGVMLTMLLPIAGQAETGCQAIVKALGNTATDVVCFASTDLTTNNPSTTPANNSLAGWPPLAFTPVTDRGVIAPAPPNQTTITKVVPGIQVEGYFADDPTHEARFLLRFPNDWNGKLVMAGASGTRSEYNGDFAWSDYVLQKGYAYASQNKGVLNLKIVNIGSPTPPANDPAPCRLNPASSIRVHFFDDDPEKHIRQ